MRKNVKKCRKIDFLFLVNFVPKKLKILYVFLAKKGGSPELLAMLKLSIWGAVGKSEQKCDMDPGSEPHSLTRLSSISTFVASKLPQTILLY